MARDRRIQIKITGDAGDFQRAIGGVSGSLKKLAGAVGLTRLARSAIEAGEAAVRMSVDFSDALFKVRALVGESEQQVAEWGDAILNLAGEIGRPPQELAEALYFVTSAGIDAADAMSVVDAAGRAAASGLGDTAVIADALTSAMNAYGSEALSAERATDIMIGAIREGKAEPDELARVIGRVIPVAAQLGVGFDQVGAAIAAMSQVGLDAGEATTALRQTLVTFLKPTAEAEEVLAKYGLTAEDLRKKIRDDGLLDTLLFLQHTFKGNAEEISTLFGNVRALTGVLNLVGSNAENATGIFEELSKDSHDLDKAFTTVSESAGFKLRQSFAKLSAIGIQVGDQMLPGILKAIEDTLPTLKQFFLQLGDLAVELIYLANQVLPFIISVMRDFGAAANGMVFILDGLGDLFGITDGRAADLARGVGYITLALEDGVDPAVALSNAILDVARTGELTELQVTRLANAAGVQGDRLSDVQREMLAYAAANDIAGVTTYELLAAFGLVETGIHKGARSRRNLTGATDELTGATGDALDPLLDLGEGFAEGDAASDGFHESLIENAETVEELEDALIKATNAQVNLTDAMRSAADPVFRVIDAVAGYRDELEDAQKDGVITREEQLKLLEATLEVSSAYENVDTADWEAAMAVIQETTGWSREEVNEFLADLGIFRDKSGKIGVGIADGILDGVEGLGGRMTARITGDIDSSLKLVKARYNIQSPSKVWAEEVGEPIATGVAKGVKDKAKEATEEVEKMLRDARDAAEDGISVIFDSIGSVTDRVQAAQRVTDAERDLADEQAERDSLLSSITTKEAELADAQAAGDTESVTALTEELVDLRADLVQNTDDLREAVEDLESAQLRQVEVEIAAIEQGVKLNETNSVLVDTFKSIAAQVGLSNEQIEEYLSLLTTAADLGISDIAQSIVPGAPTTGVFSTPSVTAVAGVAPSGGGTYTVKSGDTLSRIAAEHGMSLANLLAANPEITNANLIYPNQVVKIPALASGGSVARGGLALVGEKGIELLDLPRGATVRPLTGGEGAKSMPMRDVVVNVTTNADPWEIANAISWRLRTQGV